HDLEARDGPAVLWAGGARQTGFDTVIGPAGRSPRTARLHLPATGIECDEPGYVQTDDYQETDVPGIYALGDVCGRIGLTPVAIAAGRRLADREFGGMVGRHLIYEHIPTVIFSHPPIGPVGLSELHAIDRLGAGAVEVYHA